MYLNLISLIDGVLILRVPLRLTFWLYIVSISCGTFNFRKYSSLLVHEKIAIKRPQNKSPEYKNKITQHACPNLHIVQFKQIAIDHQSSNIRIKFSTKDAAFSNQDDSGWYNEKPDAIGTEWSKLKRFKHLRVNLTQIRENPSVLRLRRNPMHGEFRLCRIAKYCLERTTTWPHETPFHYILIRDKSHINFCTRNKIQSSPEVPSLVMLQWTAEIFQLESLPEFLLNS